jgi:hypothetical protein
MDFLSASVTAVDEIQPKNDISSTFQDLQQDSVLTKQDSAENSTNSKKRGKYKTKVEDRICTECSTVGTTKTRPWYKNKNSTGFICNTCYSRITRKEKRNLTNSI